MSSDPLDCQLGANWRSLDENSCRIVRRSDGSFDVSIHQDHASDPATVFRVECSAIGVANYKAVAAFTFTIEREPGETSVS